MKNILACILAVLPWSLSAKDVEPSDPNELHDALYKRASDLIKPYMILHNASSKDAQSKKAKAEIEEAIKLFDRVLVLNSQNWPAAWLAGKAAQSLNDSERAYAYFHKSFSIKKDNPDVARELMLACLETKRPKEAVEVATHAVTIDESDAGLKANLALAYICAHDIDGAERAINLAVEQNPTDKINTDLKRLIGEVRRGARKLPDTPNDLLK